MYSENLIALSRSREIPWLSFDDAGRIVLVLDNHLLSTYRACATHYMLADVEGYSPKSLSVAIPNEKKWYLDFGIVYHKALEFYYSNFRHPSFSLQQWSVDLAYAMWQNQNLDMYKEHKEYKLIGGMPGFTGMLVQYAMRFKPENERLRILATEVSFGKRREVILYEDVNVLFCLAGRMDTLVDDGHFIMPMDHKTISSLKKGDPSENYINDEGPTGYVYALSKILPTIVPEELYTKRDCTRILMNLISKSWDNGQPDTRFRRITLYKSTEQLEEYRLRMIKSAWNLLSDLEYYFEYGAAPKDTSHCNNWFRGKCVYFDVCRQASAEARRATLSNGFVKLPIWDTETVV